MTELVKYSKIGVQDLNNGTGTFEVTLADGRVVTMDQVSLNALNALFPLTVTATGGLTARILPNHLGARITVTDFGNETSMPLGVVSAQVALSAAVAYCYTNAKELYWPAGTYLSTATIPNFHDVRHRGPGILKRGSTLFYPDPSANPGVTNNLYVATAGVNTNDGLTSSEPRLTVQSMGNAIYGYPWADITWVVNMAAGTYLTTVTTFSSAFPTPSRVQFKGPSVGAGVQPTVIVQAATPTTDTFGWYFQNLIRVQVSDVNFKSFRVAAAPSGNTLGQALTADGRCELYTTNVWTDDCDQGIYVANGSQVRVQAGRHGYNAINGCGVQLIRHCHGIVGYNGTLADVNGVTGTAFIGGTYGVLLQEFSMSHTDTCYFSAQTQAGALCNISRIHSVSSTYDTCNVGIDARTNSNLGATTNTFTGCTTDYILRSGSRFSGTLAEEGTDNGPPVKAYSTVVQTTQSATPVSIFSSIFVAKEFGARGSGFELRLYGDVTGVANTKVIVVTLGATTLLTATIAAATLEYKITVKLALITQTSQYIFTSIEQSGVLPVYALTTTIAEDFKTSLTLTATHQVTNVADLNRVAMIELEIQH